MQKVHVHESHMRKHFLMKDAVHFLFYLGFFFSNIPNRGFNKFQFDDAAITMKDILQKILKRRKIRIRPGT